jgi:hypothetical protein
MFGAQPLAAEVPLTRLRQETRDLLRQEATQEDGAARDASIAALCDLYVVLRQDERYPGSEMLQGDAAKVRRRLLSIARDRQGRLERQGIEKPAQLSAAVDSALQSALSSEGASAGQTLRGAAAVGGLPDSGWELIELIQRVVAPEFWEEQGGPGTIRYFAMRRVLVVRATTEVHESIRELLMALR